MLVPTTVALNAALFSGIVVSWTAARIFFDDIFFGESDILTLQSDWVKSVAKSDHYKQIRLGFAHTYVGNLVEDYGDDGFTFRINEPIFSIKLYLGESGIFKRIGILINSRDYHLARPVDKSVVSVYRNEAKTFL